MIRLLFGFIAALACVDGFAGALPHHSSVPGGVALVPLTIGGERAPEASYEGNRVVVMEDEGRWYAIVGISLDAKPGNHTLKVVDAGVSDTRTFLVTSKEYTTQHITLKNQRMVNPEKQDLTRITSEIDRARTAYRTWGGAPEVGLPLEMPVEGRQSGYFGHRRVFNGEPRRPHGGIDIAAPKGTEVRAPASGRVVEAGEFFFNGKTLFINHGQGLVTMYAHLDELTVAPGQEIKRGQVIGKVGATGRATGPHLHWTVTLNGFAVDPALLLRDTEISAMTAPQ